ncbi:sugar phosphate isomerase/epimerase family protein [Pseudonocardia acidicola]|uniref:Sugar phosphate isomerase/epimerase n=1 Tax=Pseudonocardia acidicola TaxID=2724939 RepID=A0ABX1SAK6_9PSEU|nr:sugar phosphate isomerase/epimerase [Pseudonocardia acidicola]NMH97396.1 sugar phosphate isomerase/epimerase [Pseudonocardia acidicola]
MYDIGCSSLCFARLPRAEALHLISSMGFEWIDLGMLRPFTVGEGLFSALHLDALHAGDDHVKEVRDELDAAGLKLAAVNAGGGYLNVAWEREQGIAYIRRSIDVCRALGGYAVTIQSGKLLRGTDWGDNVAYVAPAVRELASHAEQAGVELHIEGPHLEMLTHDLRTTTDFFDLVAHPNLFITLDPSHVVVADEDATDVTRALGGLVRHVHIRDGAGSSPVVVPGRGEIDFPGFIRALTDIGYARPLMIELCQDESEDYESSRERFFVDTRFSKKFMLTVLDVVNFQSSAIGA